jgi:hypothetical protein
LKLQCGTSASKELLGILAGFFRGKREEFEQIASQAQMGITIQVDPIKPQYTREEESGLHLLLAEWLRMDPGITIGIERLKESVCRSMWGVVRLVGIHGQEEFVASRRTTRVWDHERKEYVRSKLSREEYAELIDFVYRLAAEDGIVLPKLERNMVEAE